MIFWMALVMVLSAGAVVHAESNDPWADKEVPLGEPEIELKKIAVISYVYVNGKIGSVELFEIPGETHDQTIEKYLRGPWTDPLTDVRQFTHINGIPIERTKWKNFAGIIRTKDIGGYYDEDNQRYVYDDGTVLERKFGDETLLPPRFDENLPKLGSSVPNTSGNSTGNNTSGDSVKVGDTVYRPFEVTVTVDGDEVVFPDQKPYEDTKAYRTMVPMRAVYEHVNIQAEVIWNQKQQTVTAINPKGEKVIFTIGKKEFLSFAADGTVKTLYSDAAPVVIKGRTYLPLRALGLAWGIETLWFKDQKLVQMTTPEGYRQYLAPKDDYLAKKGA